MREKSIFCNIYINSPKFELQMEMAQQNNILSLVCVLVKGRLMKSKTTKNRNHFDDSFQVATISSLKNSCS